MNDEGSVFEVEKASACSPCDLSTAKDATEGIACGSSQKGEAPTRTDEAAPGVLADTCTDPDPCGEGTDSSPQASELEQLRDELRQLREELAARDARAAQEAKIEHQYAEFCELFPDVPISSLSHEIWNDVRDGASLAAAYALAEKKHSAALAKATDSNASNRARSAGAVKGAQNNDFSPAEVRAMSSQEVRANLSKIKRSMQKWH